MSTTTRASARPQRPSAVRRFFKTPKGVFLLILLLLIAVAAPVEGLDLVIPAVLSAAIVAAAVDMLLAMVIRGETLFPDGAVLTGLLVALVLSPDVAWYVPPTTAAIAIASKYVFRTRWANVFNPAALALVAATFLFGSGQSWWGSLPDLTPVALVLVVGTGLFITNRLNKLPLVLTFLGAYYALFTASSFLIDPGQVAEIFRSPDVNVALFFALFMLDDPPTSPVRYADQVRFSLIVAVASFALFLTVGSVWYILGGLLVGNAWEAWRRASARPSVAG